MNPVSASPPSLLSLPYTTRKRIYVFVGLIRECPITISPFLRTTIYLDPRPVSSAIEECAYTLRRDGFPIAVSYGYEAECICPELPKELLLVCKTLHKEVENLFYGENKFIICAHRQAEDLDVFKTLSLAGIHALRYLLIRLNSWPCIRGHNVSNRELGNCTICPAEITSSHINSSDPELSISGDSVSQGIIEAWMETCQRLSHITPGTLHLEFICDVSDLASAEYIVQPLKSVPRLRDCTVRLGRKVDYALRSLAQSTALELTQEATQVKTPTSGSPVFPFFSLPREIRLHILRLTNLGPGGSFPEELDNISIKNGKFNHAARYTSLLSHALFHQAPLLLPAQLRVLQQFLLLQVVTT
ncbi:unnamed protein product [Clonostachys rosea]|uniref:F-box domain-containing protein n=1 Tax=Bionectria ochroleuca TaxID=29856 RepID=A0ABY6UAI9_BIOOC|nr:unnamed protein product [Clonostachys rosea]